MASWDDIVLLEAESPVKLNVGRDSVKADFFEGLLLRCGDHGTLEFKL